MGSEAIKKDDDRVKPEWACPKCGEDRVDSLAWLDDAGLEEAGVEALQCESCGDVHVIK